MKKYITQTNITLFLWGPILLVISRFYPDYTRYYLYLSIIIMITFMVLKMIKQRKEDKLNDTKEFPASVYKMFFMMAVVLIVFFFITRQNHI